MFVKRAISAFFIMILSFAFFGLGGIALAIILFLISCVGFLEVTRAVGVQSKGKWCNSLEIIGLIGIIAYYSMAYYLNYHAHLLYPIVGTLLLLMVAYVFSFPKYHMNQIVGTFFAFLYAPVLLGFVYFLRTLEQGIYLIWLIVIVSWVCDTSAYGVGMLFGKHKMAPVLSPKKSVEGAIGGMVGSALLGGIFTYYFLDVKVWIIVVVCLICSFLSQIGDLAASAIKRNYEIKDYGKIIPGHGGIMDRFDSMIFVAPIIYFIIILVA